MGLGEKLTADDVIVAKAGVAAGKSLNFGGLGQRELVVAAALNEIMLAVEHHDVASASAANPSGHGPVVLIGQRKSTLQRGFCSRLRGNLNGIGHIAVAANLRSFGPDGDDGDSACRILGGFVNCIHCAASIRELRRYVNTII